MASKIEICNLALTRVDMPLIQSIDERSKSANALRSLYDVALDGALRSHPWNFATRREYLAPLSETYPGWSYAYTLPLKCLWAREIYNPRSTTKKIDFEITRGSTGGRILLTNEDKAALIYTEKVTDTAVYDSLFVSGFAYYLAAELAQALKGNTKLQQTMFAFYERAVEQARIADSGEGRKETQETGGYLECRS